MDVNDKAVDVRQGEDLDTEKVGAYLKNKIPGLEGEMKVGQFPSGFSNLTYLISVGSREMVLRRPPFGKKAKTAHDMGREYRMLKALRPYFGYCPEPLLFCEDQEIMGCDFYVMERIPGIIPRKEFPKGVELSPADNLKLCQSLVEVHAKLHNLDYKAIGLGDFGNPTGYVKRQIEGWSRRYRDARTPDVPDFEKIMQWLAEKMPADSDRPGIIHNDYKFDNVVLNASNPLEIIGVLDWEMATIGDPLMDLGSSMAYWVNQDDPENLQAMRQMPTNKPGMMTRNEIVEYYGKLTGIDVSGFDYYYCFGLFRLAVIAQQIYYRYYNGQTKDSRFKMLGFVVAILEEAAMKLI
ncbi:phosphotransferase family protein [Desulforegula conservatrix]|uniref:phosphotransferase family protein n=1 Tax=Desulforegula conservatrix TaxID=153026 RepID=UPI00040D8A21|nr:phosphotransferase family protein [Desulforegula conservatrix]